MVPFLINMARLFELFVARWLQKNIDSNLFRVKSKECLAVDATNALKPLEMDLVIFDAVSGLPLCVLDTKYKAHESVRPKDYYQVLTYAENIGCTDSILIYPKPLKRPLDVRPRSIRVRGLSFDIGNDIEESGREFVSRLQETFAIKSLSKTGF